MFQKPSFGSNTSGFGSFNSGATATSPFGGGFKTTTSSAFGAPPAFGAGAAAQPTTGGGLFGSSTPSGGVFGAAPSAGFGGGGFGFGASTSGGLFGASTQAAPLFGAPQQPFQAKPAGFGFGATATNTTGATNTGSTLFGAAQPNTLFGQQPAMATGGTLFGANTGGFGQQQQAAGTAHVKYNPVLGTDVVVKAGASQSINIKHHCITCMKEYEGKSLEELRLEDYTAGRKGSTTGVFGGFSQPAEAKPLFGGSTFGQPATTSAPSVFGGGGLGGAGTGFGQTSTFSFGGAAQNTTQTNSLFGAAKPAFGATSTAGTGLFGTTSTQAPTFGTATSTFGGFGTNTQTQQSGGLFGAKPATSAFGAAPSSGFGSFGSGGGLFGAKPAAAPAATPAFGGLNTSGFGTAASGGGLFGANNTFGKPAAPAFGFNQPTLGDRMRIRDFDGGLGAPQEPLGFCASSPISDLGEPTNVIEKVNESSTSPVALSQLEQDLSSPSHLRITINTEDKKIEIEQVKVTLVYKGRGELDSTEESSFITRNLAHGGLPQITEFNIKNVTLDSVEDKKQGVTEKFPKNKETDDKNVTVFEAAEAVDVSNIMDKSQVEKRSDADDEDKMQHQNVDAKESKADDAEEILMREIENLSIKDDSENDKNLEEISSLDGIILPTEEDKELFRAPSLLMVFDYRLEEWKVREFGEIIIVYCPEPENIYQLQFRRYHNDGYETSLTVTLTDSFKLHQMRYSHSQAWEWTFHYNTEGGARACRTMAAKFLSRQVAYEFYKKIKECVLTLKSRGDVLEADLEARLLTPSQSIRLISRTPTPTFGPGTVLRSKSADICERPVHRIGSYWTSPISYKSRKIRRNSSNNETGSTPEDYRLRRPLCITPLLNDQNNSTEETKVSLVYKCHACGLCFDRPEILLDIHLSKCSPDMKLVKTKCACGLVFDQYNFTYHCQVHRQYTALNVKKIVVRDEKNLDVSGMNEVLMEEMGDNETTGEGSVRNDESNATTDKIERQSIIAKNKCETEAKVANKKATTNVLALRKAQRVYVCQCRLCFDRAEFFIKHLSKCSLETKIVKTTCICDLVFDKYNFAYHCEVHRRVTMLNVKYIVVRDEGILDISGMVQEFVEDDEINVTENMKVAFMKTVDQSLVYNPVPQYNVTQNVVEKKINNHQNLCTTEEYNNAENEDKAKYVIAESTDKVTENQTTLHEIHSSNEAIIGSQENKTDRSQAVPSNASKEVFVSTESSNKENFEVRDELTKKNDADLGPSHIHQTVCKTILTTEEQQNCNSDTDAIEAETPELTQNSQYTKEVSQISDGNEKNNSQNDDISNAQDNEKSESQKANATRENNVTMETDNEKMSNIPNNSESHNETIAEKSQCHSDSHPIDSGKKTDITVEQILVKDGNHVEYSTTKENKMEEATVDLPKETDISSESKIEHDPKNKEIETPELTQNSQYTKEVIQISDGNEKNNSQNDDISNAQDNEKGESQKANETRENNVTIETDNEKVGNIPNNSESHNETIAEKPQCNSDSDPIDSGKKTDITVEQILVKDTNHVEESTTNENKMEETTVDLQKDTDISSESKIEHDPKNKEIETPELTQNSQYTKEVIQISDGNEKNNSQNDDISNAQDNEKGESQKANTTKENNVTIETDNEKMGNIPNSSESYNETIAEKPQCNSDNDPMDSGKKTDITVKQILAKDGNHVEESTTNENKMEETTVDLQKETDISSESKIEHDPKNKENETPDLTQNSQYAKETIKTADGIEKSDNQNDDANNAQDNETSESNVTIETSNVEKSELPDKMESDEMDVTNNQKDSNLLKPTTDKDNISNIKQVPDKKDGDINVENNKKENQASNVTNSKQRKSGKQGRSNGNNNKRSKGKK